VRGHSILWLGAGWGSAFTPLPVAGVLAVVWWRVSFSIFAPLGVGVRLLLLVSRRAAQTAEC